MRTALIVAAGLTVAAATVAEARPDTRSMTCRQAQDLVAQSGAVVLSTGQYTFNRFVVGSGFCQIGEHLVRENAPTRDDQRCEIGFICEPGSPLFDGDML